jgi:hypothetical protein
MLEYLFVLTLKEKLKYVLITKRKTWRLNLLVTLSTYFFLFL